jgi:hypothetical protein
MVVVCCALVVFLLLKDVYLLPLALCRWAGLRHSGRGFSIRVFILAVTVLLLAALVLLFQRLILHLLLLIFLDRLEARLVLVVLILVFVVVIGSVARAQHEANDFIVQLSPDEQADMLTML